MKSFRRVATRPVAVRRAGASVPEILLRCQARAYRNRHRRQRGLRGFAACTLARQIFESLADLNVLLVGAGETIELVARHLREHKVRHMIIANRTRERAQLLAEEVGAEVITLPEIDERLADADIIISSTASPLPIIGKGMVERALKARRNQPMLLVDIAVPRDIEPEVGKLANAYLYSVDDLHAIIQSNLAQRKAAAVQAESIVQQESTNFMAWLRSQGAVETIRDYRSQADQIAQRWRPKRWPPSRRAPTWSRLFTSWPIN